MTTMLPATTRTCYALIYPVDCVVPTLDAFAFRCYLSPMRPCKTLLMYDLYSVMYEH